MAVFTLLQMVQEVLSSLDSDPVNSFSDTNESMAVASIIQRKYYDIAARGDLPEHYIPFQLNPSNNANIPVLMYLPSEVCKMEWLKYYDTSIGAPIDARQFGSYSHDLNLDIVTTGSWLTTSSTSNTIALGPVTFTVASSTLNVIVGQSVIATSGSNSMFGTLTSYIGTTMVLNITKIIGSGTFASWVIQSATTSAVEGYKYVTITPFDQFMDMVNAFNPSETDVYSYTFSEQGYNFTFYYKNSGTPNYCTVLSNFYVLFDSYDSQQDSTLQTSKTLAYGQFVPPFSLQDSFIPDIDDQQFSLLINEAKALAFFELKQMNHPKADVEIKRQWAAIQKDKSFAGKPIPFDQFPYFGRK